VVDTSHALPRDAEDPFLKLDLSAVEQARAGMASVTSLLPIAGTWSKAAYAPVFDAEGGVAGFAGVEASADFFTALGALRRRLYAAGGTVTAVVAVLTALYIGYARRLAVARAALQQSENLSAMGRMAAGIAHEIRNPLGIIKSTAQLVRGELTDGSSPAQLLEFIPEEVDRLNEILTGYLDFAKQAPSRPTPLELVQLLRRTLRMMDRDFADAGVQVLDNLDVVGQLPLTADPRRLQQVFLNLFLNAIQAMPEGGELRLRVGVTGGLAEIEVSDTGVGLDPAERERLFDPFVTTKEKGSGLGLSVARQIVHDHGGRIAIDGAPGRGATVRLTLPLGDSAAAVGMEVQPK
jgi:signal transduction histidine kinase